MCEEAYFAPPRCGPLTRCQIQISTCLCYFWELLTGASPRMQMPHACCRGRGAPRCHTTPCRHDSPAGWVTVLCVSDHRAHRPQPGAASHPRPARRQLLARVLQPLRPALCLRARGTAAAACLHTSTWTIGCAILRPFITVRRMHMQHACMLRQRELVQCLCMGVLLALCRGSPRCRHACGCTVALKMTHPRRG